MSSVITDTNVSHTSIGIDIFVLHLPRSLRRKSKFNMSAKVSIADAVSIMMRNHMRKYLEILGNTCLS
jgi:hypothetical protein